MVKQSSFDFLPERRDSDCIKWRLFDGDVLPLWVADMDFPAPEPVIRALRERVEHGVFGYPEGIEPGPRQLLPLREAISAHQQEHHGWAVRPEEVLLLPGVVTGFNLACHMLAEPGAGVLVQTPVYPPILAAPGVAGLERQEQELRIGPDGAYAVDRASFQAALSDSTRMFLLCNPHNPVGRVFRQAELEMMVEACLRRGVLICSDEIHCDLVYRGHRHIPIASLHPEIAQNSITLVAPSKTYNLAGLQCSAAIIPNLELRKRFLKARKGLVPWVNLMGLTAALAAYREGQPWLDELLVYLTENRDFLLRFIRAELPALKVSEPEGTYLAWLDCREAGIPGNPSEFFLKEARVALNDGRTFGRGGEGFVRLNFGCSRSVLEAALLRMKAALDRLVDQG